MTPQERELLTVFLQQMTAAQAGQKDPEAEALIRDAAGRQPDALYLLTQRALGLDYALQSAQAQVSQLQSELNQLRQPARPSFLADPNAWGRAAPTASPSAASAGSSNQSTPDLAPLPPLGGGTLQRNAPPAMQPAQAMRPAAQAGAWGGAGILGSVATTAAGVVAGGLLYQGISSMMNQQKPVAATPPEPAKVASTDDAQDDALDGSSDYADSGGDDFGGGDSA
jgi:hypothetical protein